MKRILSILLVIASLVLLIAPAAEARPEAPSEPLGSYEELEQAFLPMKRAYDKQLKQQARHEWLIKLLSKICILRWFLSFFTGTMKAVPDAPMPFPPPTDGGGDESYGTTNVQVEGIDESDVLKNDGEYLYYVNGDKVFILRALPASEMELVSEIKLEDSYGNELYILGDRLAVISRSPATVRVFDISDKAKPALIKTFRQEGWLVSSRMQEGRVYLLTNTYKNLNFKLKNGAIAPEDILPKTALNGTETCLPAEKIAVLPDTKEPGYLIASSIDLKDADAPVETIAVFGAGDQVYMNLDAIYVTRTVYDGAWWRNVNCKTQVYRFDLCAEGKIAPGPKGEAAGWPLNQFSMDEHKGFFRIATTGRNKDGRNVNILTIFDQDLKETGCIENIAPGEAIQSARFMGDLGYLVTFERVDPLFTMDLSDPYDPKILGELKIPGFSSYLHPWGGGYLIGVGRGGGEDGLDGSTKISLFDVSDPKNPIEADNVVIPKSHSEVEYNHKAFVACPGKDLIGMPMYHYGGDYYGTFDTFQVKDGAIARDLILGDALKESWVARGTYIGGAWYVLGPNCLAAYGMEDGREIGRLAF